MHIDFRAPDTWSKLNEHVAEALGVDLDKTCTRVYQNTAHALIEVCVGLSKLYPLKKNVYYFKNMNPHFDAALMPLAREGYKLVALEQGLLADPTAWVAGLAREDLFVLYSADEPILGRAYDVSKFEESLKDSNIFKIRVSHSRHFYEQDELMTTLKQNKTQANIYSLGAGHGAGHAIAILGERGRIGSLAAEQLSYSSIEDLSWFKKSRVLAAKNVLEFETSCTVKVQTGAAAGRQADVQCHCIFKPNDLRVADRAVIYWLDMDGSAVIDRLAPLLDIELKPPGQECRLETTSLSRWGGVRTMDFLASQGLSPEMIR
ncbi:MAG: hypothetical protein KDD38_05235, partial [Bdellovibrionales bacterium]|nr:hypothetical protein [Bdellovibrionales bacterium]